jgi:hypothetical protein
VNQLIRSPGIIRKKQFPLFLQKKKRRSIYNFQTLLMLIYLETVEMRQDQNTWAKGFFLCCLGLAGSFGLFQ